MFSRRRRIRRGSARFIGALIGSFLFLLYAAATGGAGKNPSSNLNILLLALGILFAGGLGAWLFPWLQDRLSTRNMRKKALRDAQASLRRSRRSGSSRK